MTFGMARDCHPRDTMCRDTPAMRKIQFDDGDTLGGTAPLSLMRQVKPARRRASSRHRRHRVVWIWGAVLIVSVAALPFVAAIL